LIAVDTNILVYAHRRDSPFHEAARKCLTELAEGRGSWAIPWPCLHEFFSVVTHWRIYSPPSSAVEAIAQIDTWFESPTLLLLAEAEGYWPELRSCVETSQVIGARIHDARIAALCRQHGIRELWSADRDFNRFSGFKVFNPLIA